MQNEQYREMMTVGNVDQLMALFGPHDENVDLVRRETGAEIFAHGDEITLSGEEEAVRLAHLVLDKLLAILAQGEGIDRSRIRYAIDLAREGNADRIEEIMQGVIAITYRGRQIKCKTLGQQKYIDAIKKNTCVFAVGPAGTG